MAPQHITVFLPCHTLGDFPTWLDEAEADDLLAAWTAAWHPQLIAAVGRMPEWASTDAPPRDADRLLGIVPASSEERFETQADSQLLDGSLWVRGVSGREAIVAGVLAAAGIAGERETVVHEADFHALGLAWLFSELLARRMRSHTGLESSGFEESVVAAARAAADGDAATARARLEECFAALEAARSHYYPVDVWLLDLVLLAESTLGPALDRELDSPVPLSLVATGAVVETLARVNPPAIARMRERLAAGTLAAIGGRHAARPLDLCTPDEIAESFDRGLAAWRDHTGCVPTTFGQITGGSSAILPGMLRDRGFGGVIWSLFDGTTLPDPGTSRMLWEGRGGATIDGVARPPLDVRHGQTFLMLPEKIGDAMDHDHTVVLQFAHHAGTGCRWHDELRRIASWCKVFGEFVTPDELFRRTAAAGMTVAFEPDSFPVTLPVDGRPIREQVAAEIEAARAAAARIVAARDPGTAAATIVPAVAAPAAARGGDGLLPAIVGRLFGRRDDDSRLVLDNGSIRIKVHEASGGLLSVRCPGDRGNRISQRLALRTTRPAPAAGQPWEDVIERAVHSGMVADVIERTAAGIESRGRLTDARGEAVGWFTQRVALAAGLPLALIDIEVRLARPLTGPPLEAHAACRFAWHENETPDLHRSLHLESVPTERWRFTAPHFIEIRPVGGRHEQSPTTIFTLGLPWHVRSSEHMLDAIIPADDREPVAFRMAIGAGIDRPGAMAIDLLVQ